MRAVSIALLAFVSLVFGKIFSDFVAVAVPSVEPRLSILAAHPGGDHDHHSSSEELVKRNLAIEERNVAARKCSGAIAEFEARRMEKRATIARRQTTTVTAAPPHFTSIQNASCVLHPETVEGPYYIRNEYVRTDLREKQTGVNIVLDIGVIDMRTCQAFPNAFVELWAANATGAYGGYSGMFGQPTGIKTDTFLRGGYFTDKNGIVEITTIYPGYYQGRTAHIHAMVHKNWSSRPNGTLASDAGTVTHLGQIFFDESWNDQVYKTAPYTSNRGPRTLNSQDFILQQAGPGAFAKLSLLQSTLAQGILGYITVVVDGNAAYRIQNNNALR